MSLMTSIICGCLLLPLAALYGFDLENAKKNSPDLETVFRRLTEMEEIYERTLSKQQETIEELRDIVLHQQQRIDKHSAELETCVKSESEEKMEMSRAGRSDITHKRQTDRSLVAFSATINALNIDHIGVHQNVVFSDVITNVGNAYNNHHGIFVAPVGGIYMFITTMLSGQNQEFAAAIEINGNDIVRMYERGTDGRHGSATQTVIVHLNKGDDVAVQSLSADHIYWGDKYSTFSGVLLQETEDPGLIVG